MNIPPTSPTAEEVLRLVLQEWREDADGVTYMPVGIGAHHWQVIAGGAPILFATLNGQADRRSVDQLERACASINALVGAGFSAGIAPLRSRSGTLTVPLGPGVLCVTPWLEGRNPTYAETLKPGHVLRVTGLLQDLHSREAPEGIPEWHPRVEPDLVESLANRTRLPWNAGPFGEVARTRILAAMDVIRDSLREYFLIAELAMNSRQRWVVTHGEPHWANQFLVGDNLFLIDWDTIAMGPPEVDAVNLPPSARLALGCDERFLRMFRLEWQLMEIAEYANRFENQHDGTEDDELALEKLNRELRPV